MILTRCGIDIAKTVFQVYGVDNNEKVIIDRQFRRHQVLSYFAQQSPCLIGIEACGTAHYWARELEQLGHTVKLMSPRFVAPYRKSGKNDRNDAIAICEAVSRPTMRFVPKKSVEQQSILMLHRARMLAVKGRKSLGNQIHGLLAEIGIILPKGGIRFRQAISNITQNYEVVPSIVRDVVEDLLRQLIIFDERIDQYDHRIKEIASQSESIKRLLEIKGIGPLTATAMVAMVGNGQEFRNGRELAAWLGLTPKQFSTGGKTQLGGITKQGDRYLRTLLVTGAHACMRFSHKHDNKICHWINALRLRRGSNVAAVALAAKNARICWAILTYKKKYDPNQKNTNLNHKSNNSSLLRAEPG